MERYALFQMYPKGFACGIWGLVLEIHELSDWNRCGADRIKAWTSEDLKLVHLQIWRFMLEFIKASQKTPAPAAGKIQLLYFKFAWSSVWSASVFLVQAERISLALSSRVATDRPRPFLWSNCPPWLIALLHLRLREVIKSTSLELRALEAQGGIVNICKAHQNRYSPNWRVWRGCRSCVSCVQAVAAGEGGEKLRLCFLYFQGEPVNQFAIWKISFQFISI